MAELVWSLVCRRVIVDEQTKLATLVDVIEGFEFAAANGSAPTAINLDVSVVCLWTRSDPAKQETTQQRIRLVGPAKKVPDPNTWNALVDLSKTRNYRNVFAFQGLPYLGNGDYVFHVELQEGEKWIPHARLHVGVSQRTDHPES